MAGTTKRLPSPDPDGSAAPPSPKRARVASTPSTLSPSQSEVDKPTDAASPPPVFSAADDPKPSEEAGSKAHKFPAEAFVNEDGHASIAGTRRGDGGDFHPLRTAAERADDEPYGLMDVSMGPAGPDQGGRMTKDEEVERREIEEAAKGVAVDGTELADAKEVRFSADYRCYTHDVLTRLSATLVGTQEKRQLKPAALEELNRIIRFPVIKNDNEPASMILLTGLKCL